jgi:hypothetical protein
MAGNAGVSSLVAAAIGLAALGGGWALYVDRSDWKAVVGHVTSATATSRGKWTSGPRASVAYQVDGRNYTTSGQIGGSYTTSHDAERAAQALRDAPVAVYFDVEHPEAGVLSLEEGHGLAFICGGFGMLCLGAAAIGLTTR